MKVKDLMIKNVIYAGAEDSVSAALNKMKKHDINQMPVMDGGKYIGMLLLKTIVTKNIDPAQSKCRNFTTSAPSVKSGDDIESAIQLILSSGARAIPVIDREVAGMISETDILAAAGKISRGLLDLTVENVATECEYVSGTDTAGKVKKIMLYKNVSRVPVVDGGNISGVVGMLDLVKLMEGRKEMPGRGGRTQERGEKEKLAIENVRVSNFMHTATIIDKNSSLRDVLTQLIKNDEALILDNGIRIVTPKDILELILSEPKRQIYVQVIGMGDEGPEMTAKTDKIVNDFVQRMSKSIENIQYLFVHVEKSHKGGKKRLYLIRARFGTPLGMFVAKAEGWNPVTVVQDVIGNLEKEVLHKEGRAHDARKKSRILKKRG